MPALTLQRQWRPRTGLTPRTAGAPEATSHAVLEDAGEAEGISSVNVIPA